MVALHLSRAKQVSRSKTGGTCRGNDSLQCGSCHLGNLRKSSLSAHRPSCAKLSNTKPEPPDVPRRTQAGNPFGVEASRFNINIPKKSRNDRPVHNIDKSIFEMDKTGKQTQSWQLLAQVLRTTSFSYPSSTTQEGKFLRQALMCQKSCRHNCLCLRFLCRWPCLDSAIFLKHE